MKKIFFSYGREDYGWLRTILNYLEPLEKEHEVIFWTDLNILPGEVWEDTIRQNIAESNITVSILSPNYLASKFVRDYELAAISEIAKEEELIISGIVVESLNIEMASFPENFQLLNDPTKPLCELGKTELYDTLADILRKLKELIDRSNKFICKDAIFPTIGRNVNMFLEAEMILRKRAGNDRGA